MNILILDDIDIATIKKLILQEGSILNSKCNIKAYQFASILPSNERENFNTNDVAINGIIKDEQYDIAFLDLEFTKEESELNERYKPIKDFINVLNKYHPYCEIINISHDQYSRGVHWDYKPKSLENHYISIPKDSGRITMTEINEAILKCLERRLQHLLIDCSQNQLNEIDNYFLDKKERFDINIGECNYKATPDKLFFQYQNAKGKIEKNVVSEKLLELIHDVPIFKDDYWNYPSPKLNEKENGNRSDNVVGSKKGNYKQETTSVIRKYPLREYYYQYYRYFSDNKNYSLNTVIANAMYSIEKVIDYISDDAETNIICETFRDYPKTKYRNLKLNQQKISAKIPDEDIAKFADLLSHRLLYFGLYYGAALSAPAINLLVDKHSYCNDPIQKLPTFLAIEKQQDQKLTETDLIIEKIKCINNELHWLSFEDGEYKRDPKKKLKSLSEYSRKYEQYYRDMAKYEKKFIEKVCNYAKMKRMPSDATVHINYILSNLENWRNSKQL